MPSNILQIRSRLFGYLGFFHAPGIEEILQLH